MRILLCEFLSLFRISLVTESDIQSCMKDGTIAEAGTHAELMAKEGEYAKLYNIQASAFIDNDSS